MFGDGERVHLERVGGRWRWVAFIVDDRPPAPVPSRDAPPSADPVVIEGADPDYFSKIDGASCFPTAVAADGSRELRSHVPQLNADALIWLSLVKQAKPSRPHHREGRSSVSRSSLIDRSGGTMF
jgi:hypothetical protein